MGVIAALRDLLPLIGGQALEDRLADLSTKVRRGNRDRKERTRNAVLSVLPWVPILAWAGVAFYRATLRKAELLDELEERRTATAERGPAASS